MSVKSKAVAIAMALGFLTSAHAVSAQSTVWEGPYVGVQAGFVYLDMDAFYTGPAIGANLPFKQDMNGFALGAFAGYNFRFGSIVAGPEIDASWLIDADSRPTPGGAAGIDVNFTGHLRGRAGYLIAPDVLLFGAAGLAIADADVTRVPAAGIPTRTDSTIMLGLSVGAGVEYAATDDIHLRLDYIYDHYFRQSIANTETLGGLPFFPEVRARTGSHTVKLGVSIDLY